MTEISIRCPCCNSIYKVEITSAVINYEVGEIIRDIRLKPK